MYAEKLAVLTADRAYFSDLPNSIDLLQSVNYMNSTKKRIEANGPEIGLSIHSPEVYCFFTN
jgi:hypothetical protein